MAAAVEGEEVLRPVTVKIVFSGNARSSEDSPKMEINVKSDGTDSIVEVKQRIAEAAGPYSVHLQVYWRRFVQPVRALQNLVAALLLSIPLSL